MRLSDTIEEFIKTMLGQDEPEIELKRNELAEYFRCAPSQINYVLSTRFTPDHGYVIESRRGGGGYIRITRLQQQNGQFLQYLLDERIGEAISSRSAQILCMKLAEQGLVGDEEARLMLAAVSPQALSVPVPESAKDAIRARILRNMILSVIRKNQPYGRDEDAV